MIGTTEVILIIAIIVILFGASKIPKIARSLGKAKGEFKKGLEEGEESKKEEKEE